MFTEILTAAIGVSLPWSSDSDGSATWLIGPAAGIGFYVFYYLRYRNTNKRHAFEKETKTTVENLTGQNLLVDRVQGVENPRVPGENMSAPRLRLGQGSTFIER